tara:strand:+ start:5743 stop:7539 length:1797 start_codon:yes stop_codon:yes gene_type:complete
MSSIIERLTEGVVNRDMRAEGSALLSKWEKTGLLEGLDKDRQRSAMARLLENQAKELLRESSSMSVGDVEGFAAVAFPIVRRVFAGLIANDLVSVQPMSLPSGLIFFLDFVYSPDLGASGAEDNRMGNINDQSIYGTDRVGSQVTGGVNLVGSLGGDLSGPRTVGARGYAYASPTGSCAITSSAVTLSGWLVGNETAAQLKAQQYDPDLEALSGSSVYVIRARCAKSTIATAGTDGTQLDYNNLGAVTASIANLATISGLGLTVSNTQQLRRLTQNTSASHENDGHLDLFFASSVNTTSAAIQGGTLDLGFPMHDDFANGQSVGAVTGQEVWGLEGSAEIPEIDIKVDSIAVTAQTKKLKAKWTPELGQDLNAYHNLDAEVELTSILSEQIALEIDREILADLVNGASASTYYWSRSPGLFVNRETGAEIGASSAAPDFTGTVSEWYETLAETINDVSAQIHRKTLRGGANFIVCGPEVANILEFTAGFRASVTHDSETGSVGAVNVGSLSKKFDVIVDPYFLRNVILVGRRGSSFLESGYVYAPYVPLQTTPTIFGVEDFVPRKGVMTRYAKKMVRPDMYGLVVVQGIIGQAGATSS